ncbi:hypothetical protein ACO1D0_24530 [Bacillus licheniformis]|uniref:hypothetical protein n=1 Tax=Bacillus licheniformis TaxID=1402 RepID=UPI003BF6989F
MRLLSQIIDDLVSGERPSHEECYKALLVYRFMLNIDHRLYREELMKEKEIQNGLEKRKLKLRLICTKVHYPVHLMSGLEEDKRRATN